MLSVENQVLTARKTGLFFSGLPRAVLSVRGKDRASFLHRLLSNDIKGLQPGQAKPACLLDRQGKILFSSLARATPEELFLEMAPFQLGTARTLLEKYCVSEAVEFSDASARFHVISAYGPIVPAVSLPALSAPDGFTAANALLGLPGVDLWIEAARAADIVPKIEASFRSAGIEPGDPEALEVLRIEAGLPAPGKEITDSVILNELGREDFVSFTKGCYVGQEIVARIKYRAHPPRQLAGFLFEGKTAPEEGRLIKLDNEAVGVLTSTCYSPTLQRPIGLGFIKHGLTHPAQAKLPLVSGSG